MVERRCRHCRIIFMPTANGQRYCCAECKKQEAEERRLETKKPLSTVKEKPKNFLSIDEMLALGRKHGIIGYDNIRVAYDKGEIK